MKIHGVSDRICWDFVKNPEKGDEPWEAEFSRIATAPERGLNVEKRKVTLSIGGQPCGFYSDDSEAYLTALEHRANAVMKRTARYAGPSAYTNAVLSVLTLTDELLRTEEKMREMRELSDAREADPALAGRNPRKPAEKNPPKAPGKDPGQVSVWDILDGR